MQAWNTLGPSEASELTLKTHTAVPEKVEGVSLSSPTCGLKGALYSCEVEFSWNGKGKLANGSPIQGYRVWVQRVPPDGGETNLFTTTVGIENSTILTELQPVRWYRFIVAAINEVGIGERSEPSDWLLTPGSPPNVTPKPMVHPGEGYLQQDRLVLTWQQPETNGAALYGYKIQMVQGNMSCMTHEVKAEPSIYGVVGAYYQGSVTGDRSKQPDLVQTLKELSFNTTQIPEGFNEDFTLVMSGWLYVPEADDYVFILRTCDQTELDVDNREIVQAQPEKPEDAALMVRRSDVLTLATGFHQIKINHFTRKRLLYKCCLVFST